MSLKNIDINIFYKKISGHIKLFSAYTEDNSFNFILKGCRMKPYNSMFNKFNFKTHLCDYWIDEYGNSLKLFNKTPTILVQDKSCVDFCVSTDLYSNKALKNQLEIINHIFICIGDNNALVLSVDKTNFFRSFMFERHIIYNNFSSLLVGLDGLRTMHVLFSSGEPFSINKREIKHLMPFTSSAIISASYPFVPAAAKWILTNKLLPENIIKEFFGDVKR